MKPLSQSKKLLYVILGYCLFCVGYLGSGNYYLGEPILAFGSSKIDAYIPFLPWTVFIYLSHVILFFLPFFVIKDQKQWFQFAKSTFAISLISFIIFFIFPTVCDRPANNSTGLTALLWQIIYETDSPTNCFPSLHISIATTASFFLFKQGGLWKWISPVWLTLIAVSTLTTKQHYFIDIAGGITIVAIVWSFTLRSESREELLV